MKVSKDVIKAERELYLDALDPIYEIDAILDALASKYGIVREDLYATIEAMFDMYVINKGEDF